LQGKQGSYSAPMAYRLSYTTEHGIKPFFTTLNQFWGIGYTDERRHPNVSGNITAPIFRVNEFQGYTGALRNMGHNGMAGHSTLYYSTGRFLCVMKVDLTP